MRRSLGLHLSLVGWLLGVIALVASADDRDDLTTLLDRKEFAAASELVESVVADRDPLWGQVATALARSGAADESKATLRRIQAPASLASATQAIAQDAAGGAAGADFDSLINLITATVAPNSWDDVGGPGSVQPFPGGVDVDTEGVLHRIRAAPIDAESHSGLDRQRRASQAVRESGDARRESVLRMISVPRLQRELRLLATFGEPTSETMRHLAGLREIRYVFLYPETGDFVIAGPAGDWQAKEAAANRQPPILLEHFVALARNAQAAAGRFGCSIDPQPANLARTQRFLAEPTGALKPSQTPVWVEEIRTHLGMQAIRIHGLDPDGYTARILVEADYHMKLIGMGLEPSVPGVPSYLASIDKDSVPTSLDVLRWWFTTCAQPLARNGEANAFVFAKQVVQLQSENERLTDRGERLHTGNATALNQTFAERFTRHYGKLAAEYPIYRQLENVFRLAIVAALMQDPAIQARLDWTPDFLTSQIQLAKGNVPREVASIVNHRVINRRHVIVGVSGGVSVDSAGAARRCKTLSVSTSLIKRHQSAVPKVSRESRHWWWD